MTSSAGSRSPWLWLATGLALALAGPGAAGGSAVSRTASATGVAVQVFAPRGDPGPACARVYPLRRAVERPAVLAGAMRALLAGPTAGERKAGYGGWFSAKTAGKLRSVSIR